ncbi:MAG: hypothetical protein QOG49_765, partial [Frankiaceae bacterium]|nr:hypothetical protein [Frankiaceae bacterium]
IVVRRVAPVAVLRRQLAAEDRAPATLRRELRLRREALIGAQRRPESDRLPRAGA